MRPVAIGMAVTAMLCVVAPPLFAQEGATPSTSNPFRFERQLRVNPFDPAALNNLAVVKAEQGRYGDAMDLLQRASRLAPDNAVIRANVGRLQAWRDTLGERDPLAEPDLGLSQVPPEPPRLWNATPP